MRTPEEIKDRIQMAIIEEINSKQQMVNEPENLIPIFVKALTEKIFEITLDEIEYRRRF